MRPLFVFVALLLATAPGARSQPGPYGAQPGTGFGGGAALPTDDRAGGLTSQYARPTYDPGLPPPVGTPGDRPSDYLRRAQDALAAGRAGEAQQSLEMAQTRLLDRSVPLGQTNHPSNNPTVGQISQALQALSARDRPGCMQLIQAALATASREDF